MQLSRYISVLLLGGLFCASISMAMDPTRRIRTQIEQILQQEVPLSSEQVRQVAQLLKQSQGQTPDLFEVFFTRLYLSRTEPLKKIQIDSAYKILRFLKGTYLELTENLREILNELVTAQEYAQRQITRPEPTAPPMPAISEQLKKEAERLIDSGVSIQEQIDQLNTMISAELKKCVPEVIPNAAVRNALWNQLRSILLGIDKWKGLIGPKGAQLGEQLASQNEQGVRTFKPQLEGLVQDYQKWIEPKITEFQTIKKEIRSYIEVSEVEQMRQKAFIEASKAEQVAQITKSLRDLLDRYQGQFKEFNAFAEKCPVMLAANKEKIGEANVTKLTQALNDLSFEVKENYEMAWANIQSMLEPGMIAEQNYVARATEQLQTYEVFLDRNASAIRKLQRDINAALFEKK